MKKLIALFAVIVSLSSFATVIPPLTGTATATGSATIITPIAIANAGNMNFGSIAVSA
jgi:spore coat protein U-like protein